MIWEVQTCRDSKTEKLSELLRDGWEPFAAYPYHDTIVNRIVTVYVLRRAVEEER